MFNSLIYHRGKAKVTIFLVDAVMQKPERNRAAYLVTLNVKPLLTRGLLQFVCGIKKLLSNRKQLVTESI